MTVNEERANTDFAEAGRTSNAVLEQAVTLEVSEVLKHRLSGPADTGEAGIEHETVTKVDGEAVETEEVEEDEKEPHTNTGLPDEEFPEEVMPPMRFCADELTSADIDELQAIYKIKAELESMEQQVRKNLEEDRANGLSKSRVIALKTAARDLLTNTRHKKKGRPSAMDQCVEEIEMLQAHTSTISGKPWEGHVQGTGSKPLSMYGPEQWAMCFPDLFPYGDGVFGLARRPGGALTFQQCVTMHLLREELVFQVTSEMFQEAQTYFRISDTDDVAAEASIDTTSASKEDETQAPVLPIQQTQQSVSCACEQCGMESACQHFTPPTQPRWGASLDLLCCYYDSWRRMEQIRKAGAHVRRAGFNERLENICKASAEKIDETMHSLGAEATIKDVLRSPAADPDVKSALLELMVKGCIMEAFVGR